MAYLLGLYSPEGILVPFRHESRKIVSFKDPQSIAAHPCFERGLNYLKNRSAITIDGIVEFTMNFGMLAPKIFDFKGKAQDIINDKISDDQIMIFASYYKFPFEWRFIVTHGNVLKPSMMDRDVVQYLFNMADPRMTLDHMDKLKEAESWDTLVDELTLPLHVKEALKNLAKKYKMDGKSDALIETLVKAAIEDILKNKRFDASLN